MKDFRNERFWYIKRYNFLNDLSKTDSDALLTIAKFKNLKHGEQISQNGVYLIKEGRIRISENVSDTKPHKLEKHSDNSEKKENAQTTEVLEQGEILGVIEDKDVNFRIDKNHQFLAETLTEVCIGVITTRDFKFFLKRKPHLTLPLQKGLTNSKGSGDLNLLTFRKRIFAKKNNTSFTLFNAKSKRANALSNIVFRSVSSRLALLIQNLALTPNSKGIVLTHSISKNQMARLIGSSNEAIDYVINNLRAQKVIDFRKGKIQITNPWILKKIADTRMKTLLPPNDSATIENIDFDMQEMANIHVELKSESNSTHSSK